MEFTLFVQMLRMRFEYLHRGESLLYLSYLIVYSAMQLVSRRDKKWIICWSLIGGFEILAIFIRISWMLSVSLNLIEFIHIGISGYVLFAYAWNILAPLSLQKWISLEVFQYINVATFDVINTFGICRKVDLRIHKGLLSKSEKTDIQLQIEEGSSYLTKEINKSNAAQIPRAGRALLNDIAAISQAEGGMITLKGGSSLHMNPAYSSCNFSLWPPSDMDANWLKSTDGAFSDTAIQSSSQRVYQYIQEVSTYIPQTIYKHVIDNDGRKVDTIYERIDTPLSYSINYQDICGITRVNLGNTNDQNGIKVYTTTNITWNETKVAFNLFRIKVGFIERGKPNVVYWAELVDISFADKYYDTKYLKEVKSLSQDALYNAMTKFNTVPEYPVNHPQYAICPNFFFPTFKCIEIEFERMSVLSIESERAGNPDKYIPRNLTIQKVFRDHKCNQPQLDKDHNEYISTVNRTNEFQNWIKKLENTKCSVPAIQYYLTFWFMNALTKCVCADYQRIICILEPIELLSLYTMGIFGPWHLIGIITIYFVAISVYTESLMMAMFMLFLIVFRYIWRKNNIKTRTVNFIPYSKLAPPPPLDIDQIKKEKMGLTPCD